MKKQDREFILMGLALFIVMLFICVTVIIDNSEGQSVEHHAPSYPEARARPGLAADIAEIAESIELDDS